MGFESSCHADLPIIEVVYPSHPSAADVAHYLVEIRKVMEQASKKGPWLCLVDQRNLKLMEPQLVEHIASMNAFARSHGRRAARGAWPGRCRTAVGPHGAQRVRRRVGARLREARGRAGLAHLEVNRPSGRSSQKRP